MKKFIKSILYPFIPRAFRLEIFYKLQALGHVCKIRNPRLRVNEDYMIAKEFIEYRQKHSLNEWILLKKILLNNLDEESKEVVEAHEKKIDYIFNNNLIDQNKFFTLQEKNQQKVCSMELKKLWKKMSKYNFSYLSSETFYGYSGLRWLPKQYQDKIKNGICIDGGAFEGDSAIILIDNFQANEVHSFEIEPNNYNKLLEVIKISKSNKIKAKLIGLSDYSGLGTVTNIGAASFITKNKKGLQIERLDNIYSPKEKISLIKLDIEGSEQNALKGAENIIKRDKPVLAISIYHNADDFLKIKPLIQSIQPGYKFIIRKASPFTMLAEVMLIAYYE